MAPRRSSTAWDHFLDIGNDTAQCKICKAKLSFKSTVSNLTKHLKRKHPFVILSEARGEVNMREETTVPISTTASTSTTTSTTVASTALETVIPQTATQSGRINTATCNSMSTYIIKKKCK